MMDKDFEPLENYVFVTKLAGFEHTNYIQGKATHTPVLDTDIPMVQGKNIRNGFFVDEFDWYIDRNVSDKLPRSVLDKPCILIPYVGSNLGEVGVFYANRRCHLASNIAKVEITSDRYDIEYVKYYLQSDIGQAYLFQSKQGSAQPNITMESIRKTLIIYRPLEQQRDICTVLLNIDKKIQNNIKLCSELEAMAKALYDYWFVQFDFPDENGKPYRTSGGAMEWCQELGREVPKGWKAGTVVDLGEIVSGATPSTTEENYYTTNGIAWITPNDLSDNEHNMFVFHGERDITEAGLSSCSAILMPAGSVLMSSRAPIGYLAIAANPVCTNQGFKSIICTKDYGTLFVYYTLKRNVQGIARQGVGTTFKEVSRDTLARYTVLLPDTTIAKHFEQLIAPISQTRKNCEQENRELIALRDWLLPMLMNGQAKVE